ncbi:uncharacterized protein LOC120286246 [Eucalyptus grandis]|uniref:uncharacterized protein LOC120286246 n=1 Tax=Eucalyptus grandis TaxID=71139 RepID=UPI00192E7742|nr:uncharacterized protein LOC120286246 [Eucalyptus grandis]
MAPPADRPRRSAAERKRHGASEWLEKLRSLGTDDAMGRRTSRNDRSRSNELSGARFAGAESNEQIRALKTKEHNGQGQCSQHQPSKLNLAPEYRASPSLSLSLSLFRRAFQAADARRKRSRRRWARRLTAVQALSPTSKLSGLCFMMAATAISPHMPANVKLSSLRYPWSGVAVVGLAGCFHTAAYAFGQKLRSQIYILHKHDLGHSE